MSQILNDQNPHADISIETPSGQESQNNFNLQPLECWVFQKRQ